MAKITLENLAHSYAPSPKTEDDFALKPLNHVWEDGAAYALLGPSGCGKTTLLNIISGLVRPLRGRILFDDVDVTHKTTSERNIAQVFQFPVIYDTMTVRENLAFPLLNRKRSRKEVDARVANVSRIIGLDDLLERDAQDLRVDVKQKISLARGLVREDVNAVLFDEPLTFVDSHIKWTLRTELKKLHNTLGRTMIYVTHDQTEALTFADHVVVMSEGRVMQIGTPQTLFETPAHVFVGHFIGSPGINLFPARIAGTEAIIGEARFPLTRRYENLSDDAVLGIRPEHIFFTRETRGFPARIEKVENDGRRKIIRCACACGTLRLILSESEKIPTDPLLAFNPAYAGVFLDGWRVTGEAI